MKSSADAGAEWLDLGQSELSIIGQNRGVERIYEDTTTGLRQEACTQIGLPSGILIWISQADLTLRTVQGPVQLLPSFWLVSGFIPNLVNPELQPTFVVHLSLTGNTGT